MQMKNQPIIVFSLIVGVLKLFSDPPPPYWAEMEKRKELLADVRCLGST
jgi:hypothetical protein